eukprot:172282-Pelagomonas_calceolata.AAC.1
MGGGAWTATMAGSIPALSKRTPPALTVILKHHFIGAIMLSGAGSASHLKVSQIMEGTREDVSFQFHPVLGQPQALRILKLSNLKASTLNAGARASESVSEQAGSIAEPEGEGDQAKLEDEGEELVLSKMGCFLWLAAITCCIAVLSEWIMDAIEVSCSGFLLCKQGCFLRQSPAALQYCCAGSLTQWRRAAKVSFRGKVI